MASLIPLIQERLETEIKKDFIEFIGSGYSLEETLDSLEDEYYGMIDYILNKLYQANK